MQLLLALMMAWLQLEHTEVPPYHPTTEWHLIAGTPPLPDPSPLIYEGDTTIEAWLIETTEYGDETIYALRTASTDLPVTAQQFMPVLYTQDGPRLLSEDTNTLRELRRASPENPATIGVDKIMVPQEGFPRIYIREIISLQSQ